MLASPSWNARCRNWPTSLPSRSSVTSSNGRSSTTTRRSTGPFASKEARGEGNSSTSRCRATPISSECVECGKESEERFADWRTFLTVDDELAHYCGDVRGGRVRRCLAARASSAYDGKRGIVCRIKYRDADGRAGDGDASARRREGWTRKRRGRAAGSGCPRRAEGLPAPAPLTFASYARDVVLRGRDAAAGSRRRSRSTGASASGSTRRSGRSRSRRSGRGTSPSTSPRSQPARRLDRRPGRVGRCTRSSRPRSGRSSSSRTRPPRAERPKLPPSAWRILEPVEVARVAQGVHRRAGAGGLPDARPDRRPPLGAAGAPVARRRPRRQRAPRPRLEVRGRASVRSRSPPTLAEELWQHRRRDASRATASSSSAIRSAGRTLPRRDVRGGAQGRARGRRRRRTGRGRSTTSGTRRSRTTPPPARPRSR